MDDVERDQPVLRVVKGSPTPEELAALTAVVSALAAHRPAPPPAIRSEWAAPHRAVRIRYSSRPGGWRASGLPH